MLGITICFAVARAAFENMGSAKAIIGLCAEEACEPLRRILRLATEGKSVMACERMSQSSSLSFLPIGSFVMRSCGGRLVNAPLVTMERRFLDPILSANAAKVS